MRMVNIGPTIEQKLAIVSKVNDIQDEKVSIVAKPAMDKKLQNKDYPPKVTLVDKGTDRNTIERDDTSRHNLRRKPRPCYRKLANLSTKTREITHNKTKRYNTRSNKILKEAKINPLPIVNKVLQLPFRPTAPVHVGKAISGELREHWIDTMFGAYNKMHNTGTLSCPLLKSLLPKDTKILPSKLSFEVKITDIAHFYELKTRFCANGSRQLEGIDFEVSFAPVADADSLRFMITIATSEGMIFIFIDASNAFQTNIISDPKKRHYISIPTMYMEWIKERWHNHPILKYAAKDLVMQSLRNIQGTKDAGYEW